MIAEPGARMRIPKAVRLLLFLPPLAIYLRTIGQFPFPPGEGSFSDVTVSHLPNLLFLRNALLQWRTIPLWSPTILSGFPFAANPISGLWYPPGWLALILPPPAGFNLLVVAHLLVGAVGMNRLLRRLGLASPASMFGSWAFVAMPKLMGHYAAGHLTLMYAVPLTPWLLASSIGSSDRRPSGYSGGLLLALIFLADSRWAFYAALLWAAWSFAHAYNGRPVFGHLGWVLKQSIVAALVAAPLALPLLEYTLQSSRSALTAAETLIFSLPPERLLGFIYPDFGGNQEWVGYPGILLILLFLVVLAHGRLAKRIRFWIVALIVSLYFALGENAPGIAWLARAPGFDLLRVPSRSLLISGISLSVIGAYALDWFIRPEPVEDVRRVRLSLFASAFFIGLLAAGVLVITRRWLMPYVWGASLTVAAAVWLGIGAGRRIDFRWWLVGVFALGLIDWTVVQTTLVAPRSAGEVLSEKAGLARTLSVLPNRPGLDRFRTYSPSYSLPQHTAARYGLELADGVDPLQLARYVVYMEPATGVPRSGYSVTMPPFDSGIPSEANAAYLPDARQLGMLNVVYVVSEFELPAEGLDFIARVDNTYIYENEAHRPRAWIETPGDRVPEGALGVRILRWSPNQIDLEATGPGKLVLSEIDYPGWQVQVDEQATNVVRAHGVLRAVELEPGTHLITFRFQPATVYAGLLAALAGFGISGFAWNRGRDSAQSAPGRLREASLDEISLG